WREGLPRPRSSWLMRPALSPERSASASTGRPIRWRVRRTTVPRAPTSCASRSGAEWLTAPMLGRRRARPDGGLRLVEGEEAAELDDGVGMVVHPQVHLGLRRPPAVVLP